MSTYDASKHLNPEDPAYWSEDRLKAATKGDDLERRMAATDWDWYWYSRQIAAGKKIDLMTAKNKNALDKKMFDLFGDDYEDTGHYKVPPDHKDLIRIKQLYTQLKDYLRITLEFD